MNNETFPIVDRQLDDSLAELATLYQAGYIKDGRDIDQDLLSEIINSNNR